MRPLLLLLLTAPVHSHIFCAALTDLLPFDNIEGYVFGCIHSSGR